jgi:hypothetical protein
MHPARRWLVFFSAAIAVLAAVLAMVLPATAASALTASAAETHVGAHHPGMIFTAGSSHAVSAVQGRCQPAPQPQVVAGLCVAAEDSTDLADAATCGGASFTASTKVLLASGAAIPISQLKPGDKVLATNVRTGKTHAEPVTAVLVHHDADRYDLIVQTARGSAVIQTTSSHLFWDQDTRRWVKAGALKYGAHLRTPGGSSVTVLGGYTPADTSGWMWDLTVPGGGDHDFYIDTTIATVLVHNCPVSPSGVGNLADGVRMSTNDALDTAEEFLGEGYQDAGDGRFINGARQVRMTDADIANPSVEPHLNFEEWENPIQPGVRNNLIFNLHVFLPEEPSP